MNGVFEHIIHVSAKWGLLHGAPVKGKGVLHFSKVMGGTGGGASFNAKYSDFYVAVARGVNQILNASRREGGRWQQKRGKKLKISN